MTHKERILVLILASINFTHIVDFMIMLPLGPLLMKIFSVSDKEFSYVVAAYAISAFLSGFTAAFFVDQFDRKKVLMLAYTGFILGTFACGIAPNYISLLMARIVAGFFGGLIGAQVLSILADSFPIEKRGTAMGFLMAAFSVASVIGVPVSIYLASKFSWHMPFTIISVLGTIILVLVYQFIPNMTSHIETVKNKNHFDVVTRIFKDHNQSFALLLTFTLMFSHFSVISFISQYMVKNVGFSVDQLAYIYLFGGGVTIFTAPIIGKLSDRYGKYKVFSIFAVIAIAPILTLTNLGHTPLAITIVITSIFFIISGGRIIPSQALISTVVDPQHRGSFMSINSSIQQLATGTASIVTGLIVYTDAQNHFHNFEYVGYGSAVLSLVCIYIGSKLRIKS
jgi:predicted MFS family arabinose efflux permease